MGKKTRRALAFKAWDPTTAKYASLDFPEWEQYTSVPSGFWDDEHNHKRYMQWLAIKLDIKELDDWYRVTADDFHRNRGRTLLVIHHGLVRTITKLIRNPNWHIWKFGMCPKNFWSDEDNRVAYLTWLGEQLGYHEPEDWYQITGELMGQHYGKTLVVSGSFPELLSELYPDYQWLPWKFQQVPFRFWTDPANRSWYMKWLGKELGYRRREDWYQVSNADFNDNHGRAVLRYYEWYPAKAVASVFDKHEWMPWLFAVLPKNFWKSKKNRISYLKWLGDKYGFQKPDDWYQLSWRHLEDNHGDGLLVHTGYSTLALLAELYPNKTWYPWLFLQTPKGYWNKKAHRVAYYRWLGKRLKLKTREDWENLTPVQIRENSGKRVLNAKTIKQLCREAIANVLDKD